MCSHVTCLIGNRAAVSRNRYGVEKTVDTHKILINAIKFYVWLQEIRVITKLPKDKTMCEVLWRNISDFYVNLRVEVGKHVTTHATHSDPWPTLARSTSLFLICCLTTIFENIIPKSILIRFWWYFYQLKRERNVVFCDYFKIFFWCTDFKYSWFKHKLKLFVFKFIIIVLCILTFEI
jgi:hypothetical protein